MQVVQATRSFVGLLATLAVVKAAKFNDDSLYHVVEDLPGNETQDNVATRLNVMARNGLNFSSFWHGAAHGLHSLHLEEIRYFFEPNATEDNKIPVVNKNLSSRQTILFDAPLAGYDEHFNTMALKVMAFFMLNDQPDFFEQGLNTLEKLTHQYHMHEIYAAAAPIYKKMKENPPTDLELCGCVNDITGNGILIEMANIARQLKYFQSKRRPRQLLCNTLRVYIRAYRNYGNSCSSTRTYGTFPLPQPTRMQKRSAAELDKAKIAESDKSDDNKNGDLEGGDAMIADLENNYLFNPTHETALILLEARPWKGKSLVGPEQWISYQAMLTSSMLESEELNDFATFMYCRLNQPDTDHPKELFD